MNIQELIAALEKAEEPSRELDGVIFACLNPAAHGWRYVDGERVASRHGLDVCESNQVPLFTSSIDAAVTLVPKGCYWLLGAGKLKPDEPLYGAQVLLPEQQKQIGEGESNAMAALAMCIAALRARKPPL